MVMNVNKFYVAVFHTVVTVVLLYDNSLLS